MFYNPHFYWYNMYMNNMKKCEFCNKDFEPKRKDSKFCYGDHYINCKKCNKEVLVKSMKHIPTYCSLSCGSQDRSYEETCEVCKEVFVTRKKNSRFCTKDHFKNCDVCGDSFKIVSLRRIPKTCSKTCASKITDFKARNLKSEETFSEKYGENITNASQLDFVKDKKKEASLSKYGVENPSSAPEVQEKRRKTNLAKFGVENGGGAKETQEKIKETNLNKYGVTNVFKVEEIKNKIKKTNLERYGVENVFELPENQKLAMESNKKRISKINKQWKKKLDNLLGIDFDLESLISKGFYSDLSYDNIYVEINPTVTHNSSVSFSHITGRCKEDDCEDIKHSPIPDSYHQDRFLKAEEAGKTLLQYFEWMDEEIFISIVRSKLRLDENRIYARKCEIKEISQTEANRFFKENHLLGAAKKQTFCVGLFFEGELVHCHSYGPARLNKNYEWEAIRSVSKMNHQVQGGFSRCDKFFFTEKKPNSVISYVDLALSTGSTELMFPGWSLKSTNKPNATWVYVGNKTNVGKQPMFIKDASVRKLSADKLLGMEVGEKYPSHHEDGSVFTNDEVLELEGYVKVFDVGTRTFVWGSNTKK